MQLKPGHPGHIHVRNQTGGTAEVAGGQEILRGWEDLCGEPQRLHEAPCSLANRLIVVDDRNQLLVRHSDLQSRYRAKRRAATEAIARGQNPAISRSMGSKEKAT